MIDMARTLVLLVSAALASGGAVLAVGFLGSPAASGEGFDYGVDTNGNGAYDWLVAEASVALPETGYWDVNAVLFASQPPTSGPCGKFQEPRPLLESPLQEPAGYPIGWAYERYFFTAGPQTVRIAFQGTDIFRAGVDAPYEVQAAFYVNGGIVYADGFILPPEPPVTWTYTTKAYRASDFEEPFRPAFFTGGHSDAAVHVDDDGLYDVLEIRADVHVNAAGTYNLNAVLTKSSEDWGWIQVAYAYREVTLGLGDASVALRFRGDQIRMAGVDGPWDFVLTLYGPYDGVYRNASGIAVPEPVDPSTHPIAAYPETLCGMTAAYQAASFDDTVELLRFTNVVKEETQDWDGDGLHDVLAIHAEVEVFVTSYFDLEGVLRSSDGTTDIARYGASAIWLPEGIAWTDWAFAGGDIRASGIDGPYVATLSIRPSAMGIDPTTTYTTRAYRATDFDGDTTSGRLAYWIVSLDAIAADRSVLGIFVDVVRGNDILTYVIEDILTTTVYDGNRNVVWQATDRVYLPSGGSSQSFAYKVDGLASATYTVVVVLSSPDRPVDTRSVTVTL